MDIKEERIDDGNERETAEVFGHVSVRGGIENLDITEMKGKRGRIRPKEKIHGWTSEVNKVWTATRPRWTERDGSLWLPTSQI